MSKIITKVIELEVYVSEEGKQTPLKEMGDMHLINAFGKAARELPDRTTVNDTVLALRRELFNRLDSRHEK